MKRRTHTETLVGTSVIRLAQVAIRVPSLFERMFAIVGVLEVILVLSCLLCSALHSRKRF